MFVRAAYRSVCVCPRTRDLRITLYNTQNVLHFKTKFESIFTQLILFPLLLFEILLYKFFPHMLSTTSTRLNPQVLRSETEGRGSGTAETLQMKDRQEGGGERVEGKTWAKVKKANLFPAPPCCPHRRRPHTGQTRGPLMWSGRIAPGWTQPLRSGYRPRQKHTSATAKSSSGLYLKSKSVGLIVNLTGLTLFVSSIPVILCGVQILVMV